ncbi:MAG: hypothetical protein J3Q66DRAFT_37414 [Benniella sp.]|nr:MAG: hypothetical protein J3Q66DRAFT_37414 [Benniella sp.]
MEINEDFPHAFAHCLLFTDSSSSFMASSTLNPSSSSPMASPSLSRASSTSTLSAVSTTSTLSTASSTSILSSSSSSSTSSSSSQGNRTVLETITSFYRDPWYCRAHWDMKREQKSRMDLAIKQVLRMSGATEGQKKGASNRAVFCIGLANFSTPGSKHKMLITKPRPWDTSSWGPTNISPVPGAPAPPARLSCRI